MTEWETVKMFKCPNCGELVQDMDDACNHVCKNTSIRKEIDDDLVDTSIWENDTQLAM